MSSLNKRTVGELFERQYEIPDYQRGYRWRKEDVQYLIDDITEYYKSNKSHNSKVDDIAEYSKSSESCNSSEGYFLNVLVVQKNGDKYDIVDGQQRLTTIAILMNMLKSDFNEKSDLLEKDRNSVDKSFIEEARNADISNLDINMLNNCWFFEYELDSNENAAEVFERINTGKIPLSSSELLKAYLVTKGSDNIKKKTIALRWQRMETLLQDDDFYYFICPHHERRRYQATRMDYILELYSIIEKEIAWDKDPSAYSAFFEEKYEKNSIFLFEKIKDCLDLNNLENFVFSFIYLDCYMNVEKHNLIGYLLYRKNRDTEFYVFNYMCSSDFKGNWDKYNFVSWAKEILDKKALDSLQKDIDDIHIHRLLLLSMLIRYTLENLPFDFVRYASTPNGWDIEHIHARNQEDYTITSVNDMLEEIGYFRFINGEVKAFVKEKLQYLGEDETNFGDFAKAISELWKVDYRDPKQLCLLYLVTLINKAAENTSILKSEELDLYIIDPPEDPKWIDSIGNLVLLPAGVNRSFGNFIYPLKCEVIKEVLERDTFYIPFCVDEKYDKVNGEWNGESAKNYLAELKNLFATEENSNV